VWAGAPLHPMPHPLQQTVVLRCHAFVCFCRGEQGALRSHTYPSSHALGQRHLALDSMQRKRSPPAGAVNVEHPI